MIGVTQGRTDFDFHQTMVCDRCGAYGRYTVYMTYMVLSLFFLPVFKWGKRYFVETSCCHRTYDLDPEIGKAIARGENVSIRSEDLFEVDYGYGYGYGNASVRVCRNCGFSTDEDFDFCPKCGERL